MVVLAFLAAQIVVPASASAAEKAIWGPITLSNGLSAFPLYEDLGVDTYQDQLNWNRVAATRPADPTNPNDPAYRWPERLRMAVQQSNAHGIKLALLVNGTPPWANGGKEPIWAPDNPRDYANFLTAAAKHYSAVRRWMIWGEPNMAIRFQPQVDDDPRSARVYAPMLDAAYGALKAVNKRNMVIGGMTWTGGNVKPAQFVRELKLPNGSRPRLDWFGHNPYPFRFPDLNAVPTGDYRDISDLDTFAGEVNAAFKSVRRAGVPLWLSEYMIQSDQSSSSFSTYVSQADQARYLTAAFNIAHGALDGVAGIGWFALVDQSPGSASAHWGLLTNALQRKPAWDAFRNARALRFSPQVAVPRKVRRKFVNKHGLAVRVRARVPGRISVQLRRGGRLMALRRTSSTKKVTLRFKRRKFARGNYIVRVLSPRGATLQFPVRIR